VVCIVFNLFLLLIYLGKVRTEMPLHVHVVGHKDHTVLSKNELSSLKYLHSCSRVINANQTLVDIFLGKASQVIDYGTADSNRDHERESYLACFKQVKYA